MGDTYCNITESPNNNTYNNNNGNSNSNSRNSREHNRLVTGTESITLSKCDESNDDTVKSLRARTNNIRHRLYRHCDDLLHLLGRSIMDVTLSNFDYCNRDDRKYCDGFNSSSSSSSSSSTSSASSFLPSILPVMQSPSPATWLSWLLFSLPLHLSTEYLESVSTQDLLDIVCGIENKSIDRVPYIDHRGLLDYPLLASTVVLSLFNSSNKQ